MSNYVRILLKEFYTELKKEIIECYSETELDESTVNKLLSENQETNYEEQY